MLRPFPGEPPPARLFALPSPSDLEHVAHRDQASWPDTTHGIGRASTRGSLKRLAQGDRSEAITKAFADAVQFLLPEKWDGTRLPQALRSNGPCRSGRPCAASYPGTATGLAGPIRANASSDAQHRIDTADQFFLLVLEPLRIDGIDATPPIQLLKLSRELSLLCEHIP